MHNKPIGSIDCSEISRRKQDRNYIHVGYIEKYFSDFPKKTIEEWSEENKNSSDTKTRRLAFIFRGQALKNKLAEEFASEIEEKAAHFEGTFPSSLEEIVAPPVRSPPSHKAGSSITQ